MSRGSKLIPVTTVTETEVYTCTCDVCGVEHVLGEEDGRWAAVGCGWSCLGRPHQFADRASVGESSDLCPDCYARVKALVDGMKAERKGEA